MTVAVRHDWSEEEVLGLFNQPFSDLMFTAQTVHRQHFDPNQVQVSTLLSIKTGTCPEDCKYCPQSAHYNTGLEKEKLLDMVKEVKALGLETCMTLGMLSDEQAADLADAGLDYYNHNLDTSPEHYGDIITTRTYQDRLDTLANVRSAGMKVCCGGIVGMGEELKDRAGLLVQLANLEEQPESVPINMLVKVEGTPLENTADLEPFDFLRTIAVARILMPKSHVRLSAGREEMNEQMQALAFLAGANSIFYGEKLLTTPNPSANKDMQLFDKLGIQPEQHCVAHEQEVAVQEQITEAAMDKHFYNADRA